MLRHLRIAGLYVAQMAKARLEYRIDLAIELCASVLSQACGLAVVGIIFESVPLLRGWSRAEVDTLDVYDGSSVVYNFPTEAAIFALLQQWFATVEIIRCGSYPLAERCPLLMARRPISSM